jgi:homoserine dehydrogenase
MKVGVLGFGNVAAATIESFMANQELIHAKTRVPIQIIKVATRTPARAEGRVPEGCAVSSDCWGLVDDPQIDVIVELTGDVTLGRQLVLRALSNRKHVVTANKALLAKHGEEIMAMAERVDRNVLFEGAVAVSIPIIKTLRESAAANRITSVTGILNGTSNYVLSQMSEHGADFAIALAQAQRNGYAEADPTLDINGEDAAHKLTLLASLCFGVPIDFSSVQFQGIQNIDRQDISFAKRLGYQIKLIAQAHSGPQGIGIGVHPMLVPSASMLAQVANSMNGISLKGDLLGTAFLYGSGAGGRETSSAVLADLIELANRNINSDSGGSYNMGFRYAHCTAEGVRFTHDRDGAFYIRLRLDDKPGVLARVSAVLAGANVSVNTLVQDEGKDEQADLVIITHDITGNQLHSMLPSLYEAAGPGHSVVIYAVLGEH